MDDSSAFKNFINESVAKKISKGISAQYPDFNSKKFLTLVKDLKPLELKARVLLITKHLHLNLPTDYKKSLDILMSAMKEEEMSGFELWPFSEYISQFGLDHFDESMKAMYELTQRFTAEFAIRPFLLKNHTKVLKYFKKWTKDRNVHIRRWVSEGSRPLLPWGQRIPLFVMDPTHTLILLDDLRFDEELYVRKSVANHLNDISKNHPQVVIDVLRMWEKSVPEKHVDKLNWIKRHALRTLIKKGHKGALKLMGVEEGAKVKFSKLAPDKKKYKLNDSLKFSFFVKSESKKKQKLIVDYSIDFIKSNGKLGKKIFKLKTFELEAGEMIELKKAHSLKPITTMKYYSGTHHLTIQINGETMGTFEFYLEV